MGQNVFEIGDILLIELNNGRQIQAEFVGDTENAITVTNCKDLHTGKEFTIFMRNFIIF